MVSFEPHAETEPYKVSPPPVLVCLAPPIKNAGISAGGPGVAVERGVRVAAAVAVATGVERVVVLVARGPDVGVGRSFVVLVVVGSAGTVPVAWTVGVPSSPCVPVLRVGSTGTDVAPGVGPTIAVGVESAGTGEALEDS